MEKVKQRFERRRLADELKQRQAITDRLLHQILYSKRLLVDHVEALEQCMQHLQPASSPTAGHLLSTRNACLLLGGTVLQHFITPRGLRLTLLPAVLLSGTFGALYAVRSVFVCRNKIVERKLEQLIRTIDEFGNCIRRNMTYFQEIIIMKQAELIESRQIERAWDCITAAKEVTEILYDATRKLETDYPLPADLYGQFYAPMEELRECEYFKNNVTDYSPKHIKDFHNIFAYVQSQYLLRLALTITTQPSISQLSVELVKIDCLVRQLVLEEEQHFKNLAIAMQNRKRQELAELHAAKTQQQPSGPIEVLQHSSLKLSACMVAVAGECQALDVTLQQLNATEAAHRDNAKQLVAVANNMRGIENALAGCCDDFQRLMLVYNKFLHSKLDEEDERRAPSVEQAEFPESFLRVEFSQHPNEPQQRDDFYAYMYDEQEMRQFEAEQAPHPTPEKELLNFEKRITKGKFKPVLRQLKDRIDPIRQVMLEREREVLAAKGINVDELFGKIEAEEQQQQQQDNRWAENRRLIEEQDSADSAEEEEAAHKQRSKQLKDLDNFAEMRNFLAQKMNINLYELEKQPPLPQIAGEEELLESEC